MIKPILLVGFLLVVGFASAQYLPIIKTKPSKIDTSFLPIEPKNQIPNVLAHSNFNKMLIPKGNNGEGFDLYESTFDGMTVAKPDKSQLYIMPNGLQKNQLQIIVEPSEFNTGNLQIRIPQPFTDTMYIPPFNTKKFNPSSGFKK